MERSERYLDWWAEFRKQFLPAPSGVMPRCLITGELAPALLTVPKVSGLMAVGVALMFLKEETSRSPST